MTAFVPMFASLRSLRFVRSFIRQFVCSFVDFTDFVDFVCSRR